MKTLRDFWSAFYSLHESKLIELYPGLELDRFLREVSDILILRTKNPKMDLSYSVVSASKKMNDELVENFLHGIPFSYILGESEFYYQKFIVDPRVLIPRPETELLIDMIVEMGKISPFKNILDVGTGSGVILLSILKKGSALKGVGTDISQDALDVARINAKNLRLTKRVSLLQGDRLEAVREKFDLIVSNPPYIKETSHRSMVQNTVHSFEPKLALYLPDSQYEEWFTTFFTQIRDALLPNGLFMMEGHELEVENQTKILTDLGFQYVKVLKDWGDLPRFLQARAP